MVSFWFYMQDNITFYYIQKIYENRWLPLNERYIWQKIDWVLPIDMKIHLSNGDTSSKAIFTSHPKSQKIVTFIEHELRYLQKIKWYGIISHYL